MATNDGNNSGSVKDSDNDDDNSHLVIIILVTDEIDLSLAQHNFNDS